MKTARSISAGSDPADKGLNWLAGNIVWCPNPAELFAVSVWGGGGGEGAGVYAPFCPCPIVVRAVLVGCCRGRVGEGGYTPICPIVVRAVLVDGRARKTVLCAICTKVLTPRNRTGACTPGRRMGIAEVYVPTLFNRGTRVGGLL
jgi:hypothetical protein